MITTYQSNAITYLRVISMLMIIACHICQVFGNHWAWVLNIGVQIFFVISGYLYGNRQILNWPSWFYGRLRKVYLPFVIYLAIVLPLYTIFHRECISIISPIVYLLNLQGMYWGVILGLNHLWFLTDIGICYAFTPLLQIVSGVKSGVGWKWIVLITMVWFLWVDVVRYNGWHYHVLLFGIAYMIGKLQRKAERLVILAVVSIASIPMLNLMSWDIILHGEVLAYIWRVISSLFVFVLFLFVFEMFRLSRQPSIVRFFCNQSYYAYIVHHIYIIGPFSVIAAMEFAYVTIIYIVIIIIVSSVILSRLSSVVENKVKQLWIPCEKKESPNSIC